MSIIEFIGFIITMVAMTLLFRKRVKEERHRRNHPEHDEEGLPPTDPMKQFLRALEQGEDEEEEYAHPVQPPAPPTAVAKKPMDKRISPNPFSFQPKLDEHHLNPKMAHFLQKREIDSRQLGSSLDNRYVESSYEVHRRASGSYAAKVINRLPSRRDMMICHEIFSRPKGW